jgi:hypothetical protein
MAQNTPPLESAPAPPAPPPANTAPVQPNVYVSVAAPPSSTEGEHMNTQILSDLLWPLLALIALLLFRKQISDLLSGRGTSRIKSLSFAGFSLELAAPMAALIDTTLAATDIRKAGSEKDVNDSTLRSFYEQISLRRRLDYTVVDIGVGADWLTSRLYVLAVIMRRMRGIKFVVFVASDADGTRRFLGMCDARELRWRLARWYSRLEAALAAGEARACASPSAPLQIIDNDEGRFTSTESAAELLRGFLTAMQASVPPSPPEPQRWQMLAAKPGEPPVFEYAEWLTQDLLERLLGETLKRESVELRDTKNLDEAATKRMFAQKKGDWIILTQDAQFYGVIDRRRYLESMVRE